jgi:3-hydroxyacyl-[acyl-carrier-protein] dehydratase
VVPGDQLRSEVTLEWMRGTVGRIKGLGKVDGELVCEMEMTFKLLEKID